MGSLSGLLKSRRGKYRAFFDGKDLGDPAAPPEIRAKYDTEKLTVHGENSFSCQVEGEPELSAEITLKLYDVTGMLPMLSEVPALNGELILQNSGRESEEVRFPECRLLPEWEFVPSFTGEHLITVKFRASTDETGKLFYFSGA